ncbi:MAG: ATP synthase F0 subunit B [bacterium]
MTLLFSGSAIQLVPDGTLLFHLVLIVFMVILLNATLLRPINRVLEIRERRTKGRFGEAERALRSAEEKVREYERRLREARAGGYALLDEVRSAAAEERERKVSNIKAELSRWRDRERENLKKDEAAAKMNLMKEASARAAEISRRILGREVSPPGQ